MVPEIPAPEANDRPEAEDKLNEADNERQAAREGRDAEGRPLRGDETAPGERSDGPYGDSEPGKRARRPGTT
jgi:hypothetical protein